MKISDRGYWISKLYRYQSLLYWFFYAIYFRNITYFSAANPGIYLGGMLNERKSDIHALVPSSYMPQTRLFRAEEHDVPSKVRDSFSFPLIIKPDIGYKGYLVKKIDNPEELHRALEDYADRDILVQEFVDMKREFSVMYYRLKKAGQYGITSLVEKHLPVVEGDGYSTLRQLIEKNQNPFLNRSWLLNKYHNRLSEVLPKGEKMIIDHIGNYSRGAKFENINHSIDAVMEQSMNRFFDNLDGINFCRLDVKAASLEDLRHGKFIIIEINGAKSEPLHIYDPQISIFQVIADIRVHWKKLFKVVRENRRQIVTPSAAEGIRSWRRLKKSMQG